MIFSVVPTDDEDGVNRFVRGVRKTMGGLDGGVFGFFDEGGLPDDEEEGDDDDEGEGEDERGWLYLCTRVSFPMPMRGRLFFILQCETPHYTSYPRPPPPAPPQMVARSERDNPIKTRSSNTSCSTEPCFAHPSRIIRSEAKVVKTKMKTMKTIPLTGTKGRQRPREDSQ